jgi:hypothetical protein
MSTSAKLPADASITALEISGSRLLISLPSTFAKYHDRDLAACHVEPGCFRDIQQFAMLQGVPTE